MESPETKAIRDLSVRIIGLPNRFKTANASIYALLKYSGYFEMHDRITTESIREALSEHPDYIDDWIQYSEDKRCGSGWFILPNGTGHQVGFYSSKAGITQTTNYSDRLEACATFIKNEIEAVRKC
jgi:hypothetical protein